MEGIQQMFDSFSRPDEFTQQAQLELFAWRASAVRRARQQRWRDRHRTWVREQGRFYMANRYRTDPEFRAKQLERARSVRESQRKDAAFVEKRRAYQRERHARMRRAA